jgi:hypothetical protein
MMILIIVIGIVDINIELAVHANLKICLTCTEKQF